MRIDHLRPSAWSIWLETGRGIRIFLFPIEPILVQSTCSCLLREAREISRTIGLRSHCPPFLAVKNNFNALSRWRQHPKMNVSPGCELSPYRKPPYYFYLSHVLVV